MWHIYFILYNDCSDSQYSIYIVLRLQNKHCEKKSALRILSGFWSDNGVPPLIIAAQIYSTEADCENNICPMLTNKTQPERNLLSTNGLGCQNSECQLFILTHLRKKQNSAWIPEANKVSGD